MVHLSFFSGLAFAHGNDPRALPPAELFGHWALAIVALVLAGAAARMALQPVFEQVQGKSRSELAGWTAVSIGVLVAMATWITRQSLLEATSPPPPPQEHGHALYHGGQIAMWGDYHCEVARVVSGEYRVWLTDVYRRPISAKLFEGTLHPRNPETGAVNERTRFPLELSLDNAYRFAVLPRDVKTVQLKLVYPGNSLRLDFEFDKAQGKKSLKDWCGM